LRPPRFSAGAAWAQTTLRWSHAYETTEVFHTEAVRAAEQIAQRTEGRYKIDVYPSSQLGNNNDMDRGLTLGTVDFVYTNNAFAATAYPPIDFKRSANEVLSLEEFGYDKADFDAIKAIQ
jgi:TRAP-type C4-dicarboxylate transport system substrate-binding protein